MCVPGSVSSQGITVPPRKRFISDRSSLNPAGSMIRKRLAVALMALSLGPVLGSCAQVSGTVSDHWPHWAGGLPADAPPRPGTPDYAAFIAHRQAETDAAQSAAGDKTNQQASAPAAANAPPPTAYAPPATRASPPPDPTVARGGLY
jgi:hypothetical protein